MIKQLLLLGILMDGKMHGYQLNEHVKHAMSLYTDLKKSTTYFVLDQLAKDGYVQCQLEREGKRPERRVYEITKYGKVYFQEQLRECLVSYTPATLSSDLGIAFMEKLKESEVKELLEKKREKIKEQIEKYKGPHDHGGNLKYVIDHHIAYLQADLNWVDRIIKGIKKEN